MSLVRKADDILLAFLIQIFYFGQIPDTLATIGSVMITVSVLVSGARKIVDKKVNRNWLRKLFCLRTTEPEVIVHLEEEEEEGERLS